MRLGRRRPAHGAPVPGQPQRGRKKIPIPRSVGQILDEARRVLRDPALTLWAAYILLFPIYIFDSGLPQPGDIIALGLIPFTIARRRKQIPQPAKRPLRTLMMFVVYVVVINMFWSVALNMWSLNLKLGFWLSPLFYLYNAMIFAMAVMLYQRYGPRFLWLTAHLTLVSVAMQVMISFVHRGGSSRTSLLFNNPNQLGYYALLSACVLMLGQRKLKLSPLAVTFGLLFCSYLAFLSQSKAALLSMGILILAGVIDRLRTMLISMAVFGMALLLASPFLDAIQQTQNRFENDKHLGFFEERGYDRIVNNPEHLVIGAGEGGYVRFDENTAIGDHELHSSLGSLVFCYGVVGTFLFGSFLLASLRGAGVRHTLLFLPALSYGMTHQGLRFTLLWVLIAMVIALKDIELQQRQERRAAWGQAQAQARAGAQATVAA